MQKMHMMLQSLAKIKTSNTTMISLYVPGGKDIGSVLAMIASEKALCSNIKSKSTRKEVQSALEQVLLCLAGIMFSPLEEDESKLQKDNCIVIIPPHPLMIKKSLYRCDKQFFIDDLLPLFQEHKTASTIAYGVALISGSDFLPFVYGILEHGSFNGQYVKAGKSLETVQTKKQKKGGQSAQRFGRIHDEKRNVWIKKIVESLNKAYLDGNGCPVIKGLVLAGPSTLKQELIAFVSNETSGLIPLLGPAAVHIFPVGSIESMMLQQKALSDVQKNMASFFELSQRHLDEEEWQEFIMASQKGGAVYGEQNVVTALKNSSLRKILINQNEIQDVAFWDELCATAGSVMYVVGSSGIKYSLQEYGNVVGIPWFVQNDDWAE